MSPNILENFFGVFITTKFLIVGLIRVQKPGSTTTAHCYIVQSIQRYTCTYRYRLFECQTPPFCSSACGVAHPLSSPLYWPFVRHIDWVQWWTIFSMELIELKNGNYGINSPIHTFMKCKRKRSKNVNQRANLVKSVL